MKYQYLKILILISIIGLLVSCNHKKETDKVKVANYEYDSGDKILITNKIMYDVPIVNENIASRDTTDPDWFWENLPTPDANIFIKTLLEDVSTGKLKSYYYQPTGDYESFEEIKEEDLDAFIEKISKFEIEVVDTVNSKAGKIITKKETVDVNYKNVKKLRFLEEWYLSNGEFKKRVIAIAPFFYIEHPQIDCFKTIYFWIFVNNKNNKIK